MYELYAYIAITIFVLYVLIYRKATIKIIAFILRHTFFRVRALGLENIPQSGPLLFVSNHVSLLDLFLIQGISRRKVTFMARTEIMSFLPLRLIFWYIGGLQVPNFRHPKALKAFFKEVQDRLRKGDALCFFPEGAISGNGNLMRFRSNVEPLLPEDVEVVVLPIRIGMLHGRLFSFVNKKLMINWPKTLPVHFNVTVGEPIDPHLSAFELRQKISELGAISERLPQPGEEPLHTAFMLRAKKHPFQKSFYDAETGDGISNFKLLVFSILLSRKVRKLDGEHGSAYVGVLLPNCYKAVAMLFGVLMADKTPAMLNFSAGEQIAIDSARRAGVKTIFTSRKFLQKLKWQQTEEMVILEELAPTITKWEKLLVIAGILILPGRSLVRNVSPFSCHNMLKQAVLLFSSGSTGKPKAVMLTQRNINCDIWSFLRMIAVNGNDRLVGNLPLFHGYGFTVLFAFPALHGIMVAYLLNPLGSEEIIKAIEKFKLTILTATPTFLQKYLHKATAEKIASLRLVITGAEKLRPELSDRFYKMTGKEIIEGYGCTELSPIVTVNFNNSIFDLATRSNHPGSIGCPLPGVHVRIVDTETGVELPPGKSGKMQVKSGTVMLGYLNDPEQTARVIQDGYYDTGDIARFDDDGYIYITGRASRFSKIGGEMVPHEGVEDGLLKFLACETREVAVTGKSDSKRGEKLVVFYSHKDMDIPAAIEYLQKLEMPNLWIPKKEDFYYVEELPLLGSGKLDLRKLAAMAEELNQTQA